MKGWVGAILGVMQEVDMTITEPASCLFHLCCSLDGPQALPLSTAV